MLTKSELSSSISLIMTKTKIEFQEKSLKNCKNQTINIEEIFTFELI